MWTCSRQLPEPCWGSVLVATAPGCRTHSSQHLNHHYSKGGPMAKHSSGVLSASLIVLTSSLVATAAQHLSTFGYVAEFATGGTARDVVVQGRHAYVADGTSGLKIIDLSNPADPIVSGSLVGLGGTSRGIAVSGGYAYIVTGTGLKVVNIADPTKPTLAGSYTDGSNISVANHVKVLGEHAYVSDGYRGLLIFNVSDPARPVYRGRYYPSGGVSRPVGVSGSHVYLFGGPQFREGLIVIDVSDPSSPTVTGTCRLSNASLDGPCEVSGSYAYAISYDDTLMVFDVRDPSNPTILTKHALVGSGTAITVSDNHLFVVRGIDGVQVFDVSNPSEPVLKGNYDTPGRTHSVSVSGDYAVLADDERGLQVFDVKAELRGSLVGACNTPGFAHSMMSDVRYIADGEAGLLEVDASDPAAPTIVGTYDTPGEAVDCSYPPMAGPMGHVLIADAGRGLQILRTGGLGDPSLVGNYNTPGRANSLAAVRGRHAYIADGSGGLQIVDVSDPANPSLAGTLPTGGEARSVAVWSNVFVADVDGLRIVRVSTAGEPTLIGSHDTPGQAVDVIVSEDYAYVADGDCGVQIYDKSDSYNSFRVGGYDTPGLARTIKVVGNLVYVSYGYSWVDVLNVTSPSDVHFIGRYITQGGSNSLVLRSGKGYSAEGGYGLTVFDLNQMVQVRPHRFSSECVDQSAVFRIRVHQRGAAVHCAMPDVGFAVRAPALLLVDPLGRRTMALPSGAMARHGLGTTSASWRMDRTSSGIYFLSASDDSERLTGRLRVLGK